MRPEKADIVAELGERLNASPFVLVVDYKGLGVSAFTDLRRRLAAVGAQCKVVKNTFLKRAAAAVGLPDLGELSGQTAIVVGEADVAAAAKVVKTFAAESQKPKIRGGVIDRVVVSAAQVVQIAVLPAREILLAQLLGVFQAPATKLARVLNEPATALARVLKAKADRDGGGGGGGEGGAADAAAAA